MKRLIAALFLIIFIGCEEKDDTPYIEASSHEAYPLAPSYIYVENGYRVYRYAVTSPGLSVSSFYSLSDFCHYLPGTHPVNVKMYGSDGKLLNEQDINFIVKKEPLNDFLGINFRSEYDYLYKIETDTMKLQLERYWDYEPHTHYAGITCEVKDAFKDKFDVTAFLSNYMAMFYGKSEYVDKNGSGTLYETYDKIFERKLIELNEMPVEIWKAPKCDIALIKTTRNTSYIIAQKKPLM